MGCIFKGRTVWGYECLRAWLFKGPSVTGLDCPETDCGVSDGVGPDCAGPNRTCTSTHCPASAFRCGYSRIFLVCSIQVNRLERLLVDRVCSSLGSGDMNPHHKSSYIAGLTLILTSDRFYPYRVPYMTLTPPPSHWLMVAKWEIWKNWVFWHFTLPFLCQTSYRIFENIYSESLFQGGSGHIFNFFCDYPEPRIPV